MPEKRRGIRRRKNKMKDMAGKAKSTMESAAQVAKEKYEQVKQENAEKKAQKEAYIAEMEGKAAEYGKSLCSVVKEKGSTTPESFMSQVPEKELLAFTKIFMKRWSCRVVRQVFPASSCTRISTRKR